MTTPTTDRRPAPGDLLYLDGFVYVLDELEPRLDKTTREIVNARLFRRPGLAELEAAKRTAKLAAKAEAPDAEALAATAAELEAAQAALKANYNYKKSGKCIEAELRWISLTDLSDEIRTQSATLQRGNPARAAWAAGAAKVQVDRISDHQVDGFWTLPGRYLLKPPVILKNTEAGPQEFVAVPTVVADAEQVAAAVLAHAFTYDRRGEN